MGILQELGEYINSREDSTRLLKLKKIAEQIPNRSNEILEILIKDTGKMPPELLDYLKSENGSKVGLEKVTITDEENPENSFEYIQAHLFDPNGQENIPVDIATESTTGEEYIVSEDIYEKLESLCIDFDEARTKANISMANSNQI